MKYNINLVGTKQPNLIDKTVYFLLHYIRYILVFTQFIVLAVFFFRFTVDEKIIDLKDSIGQKKAILEVAQPILAEAKRINDKAEESQVIVDDQEKFLSSIKYVLSIFPEALQLERFELEEDKLLLSGVATDPRQLQLFYERLQKEGRFGVVVLSNVKRQETGYQFLLELGEEVKKPVKKKVKLKS